MTQQDHNISSSNELNVKDFLLLCLDYWRWFVLSLLVCLLIAFLYVKKKPNVYTRTAEVMINEEKGKSSSINSQLSGLSDMGMFGSVSNVDNELLALKSPSVILEVVNRMHLDVSYMIPGYRKTELYGTTLPVSVSFSGFEDTDFAKMRMTLKADGTFVLSDFLKNKEEWDQTVSGKVNTAVSTPLSKLSVISTDAFREVVKSMKEDDMKELVIDITRIYPEMAREICRSRFSAEVMEKKASVISMSYQDVSKERADDFLNMMLKVYQENWMRDKNQVALSTYDFINERLGVIEKELGNVDSDISSYKSKNLIPDIEESTKLYMKNANDANTKIIELNTQLYVMNFVKDFMKDNSKKNQILPANMIPNDAGLNAQINQYNTLQLERNKLAANSSSTNPLVVDIDEQLLAMRKAISSSIENSISHLRIQISGMHGEESKNNSQIASSPARATHLLSVERQQKVKEALYIYLLQKREENQLSQAFTAYNTRLITPPMGGLYPTSPKKRNIWMIACLLGLAIPAGILYLRESLDTKIRGKKDIESLSLPYIGEIPLHEEKKKGVEAETKILVKPQKRNMINEAFRVVRTNLEFMANSYEDAKVFMVTSINVGSGKTFLTINLASIFAIKDKKTILLDLDIRKASLNRYLDFASKSNGVTNILSGQNVDWRNLIVHSPDCPSLDILPCGTIPPNPAELLSNGRLHQLMEELKSEYDYIFLDCAPVDIVADTSIIAHEADVTLFIIRSGLLDKNMLPTIEEYYTSKKLKNMGVILNGSKVIKSRYGYHRYGYGYGYGYGSKGYGSYTHEDN